MRQKILIIVLALALVPFVSYGQSVAKVELSQEKSLWFNSSNAAGLVLTPLVDYNEVSLGYQYNKGNFKYLQQGESENVIKFNTNGALKLNGFNLWGDFTYNNYTIDSCLFNTTLLDPINNDNPYYIADNVVSKWKKQSYDLRVKATTPMLWNFMAAGVDVEYFTSTGAKQNDPRSTTYDYKVVVKPGFIFKAGERHSFGISGLYENGYQTTTPTNSDSQVNQIISIMKGLGFYSVGSVGGLGSVSTFFYKRNKVGGALQYGLSGRLSALLDLNYHYLVEDTYQAPTKPQRMGSIKQELYAGKLQMVLNGDVMTNKLSVDYMNKSTDGIEFMQELDKSYEVQKWVTFAKYIRSNYSIKGLVVKYDLFKNAEADYKWNVGVKGEYTDKFDEYYLPNATLSATNFYYEAFAKKNFSVCNKSQLLGAINIGFNNNSKGEYKYSGPNPTAPVVDFYRKDIEYMTSNYFRLGAMARYSFPVAETMNMFVNANVQWLKSSKDQFDSRLNAILSVGLDF